MNKKNVHLDELARNIRKDVLKMVHKAKASHIGSCYSIVDIVAVLYGSIMKIDPKNATDPNRDRIILSKGHAAAAIYGALANVGILDKDSLSDYGSDGSLLMTHISHKIDGVEFSSGALGHGLPFGVGKALASKKLKKDWRTFVILSDGEMDEGSNWEALMFASHHKLDNLIAILDYNKLQSLTSIKNTLGLEPLFDKLVSFGWEVKEVDGHDLDEMNNLLSDLPWKKDKPNLLIMHTIKGKGVSFMENKVEWHYKSPNEDQFNLAMQELSNEK